MAGKGGIGESLLSMRCRGAVSLVIVILFSQSGLAAHHYQDYPVRPAGDYAIKVVKPDVTVAVEPLDDAGAQKTYFNGHFTAVGVLPVFLVIQNNSGTDSLLFDKSEIGLADSVELTGKAARKIASRLGSGGLVDLSLIDNSTDGRANLVKKEIRSKTLSPGMSVSGFVYLPVPTNAVRPKIHLEVPLTNVQSGETEVVNIVF